MTERAEKSPSSWKMNDILYGVLGFGVGFFIMFSITNAVQRDAVMGRTSSAQPGQQAAQLPPDHPSLDGGTTGASTADGGALPPGHPSIDGGSAGGAGAGLGPPPPLPPLEPRANSGPKAEDRFKDIQTLRGLPPKDVQMIMGIMTVSLGVDCTYCHVPGSYESPHPKKEKAREMIRMVKTINKDFVGGKVNCYTCHRGSPKPATQ